ncbi:hypothetical protein M407DRAFT_234894 [Tulasnella calospora MUT 4182]|uniref:BRCA1-associated protein n=1 Tax=Tulasnella calospora MUT 4182 TaxID=1051891 RepID=A0A0C3QJR4_9AGAM|nr:hypothetical protein M407DRAFT_234894 [Tulasnella calospora MUT 4182]
MQNYRFVFSLSPTPSKSSDYSASLKFDTCVPSNIFDVLPSHTPQSHHYEDRYDAWRSEWVFQHRRKESSATSSGKQPATTRVAESDWRHGPISIEWFDNPRRKNRGKKPPLKESMAAAAQASSSSGGARGEPSNGSKAGKEKTGIVASWEPNPDITFGTANLPEGIIRIFRDTVDQSNAKTSKSEEHQISSSTHQKQPVQGFHADGEGTTLAVLAIPFFMTPADFLGFLGSAEDQITHIRIIRDGSPSRTIALLKFRSKHAADEFGAAFNGREFLPTETEICHVVRVLSIDIDVGQSSAWSFSLSSLAPAQQVSGGAIYELPTCPVCLERMDYSVTGLVTVPCSHTFHCVCLSKWGDSRCPVCRYSQNLLNLHPMSTTTRPPFNSTPSDPSTSPLSTCSSPNCGSHTNLWICLICGNVGCGRYGRAHAYQHYKSTMHLYALELETQRVWDYAGDGYVHRLIQNKADGKVYELPSASTMTTAGQQQPSSSGNAGVGDAPTGSRSGGPGPSDALAAEKVEAIGIEYSYLLSTQLDKQRAFFEDQQKELQGTIEKEKRVQNELREQISTLEKEKAKADERAAKTGELAKRLEKELREEKVMTSGLKKNLDRMQEKVEAGEAERKELKEKVNELSDQLRDLMFFLEARDKIEAATTAEGSGSTDGDLAEAAGGSVVVPPPKETMSRRRRKK